MAVISDSSTAPSSNIVCRGCNSFVLLIKVFDERCVRSPPHLDLILNDMGLDRLNVTWIFIMSGLILLGNVSHACPDHKKCSNHSELSGLMTGRFDYKRMIICQEITIFYFRGMHNFGLFAFESHMRASDSLSRPSMIRSPTRRTVGDLKSNSKHMYAYHVQKVNKHSLSIFSKKAGAAVSLSLEFRRRRLVNICFP